MCSVKGFVRDYVTKLLDNSFPDGHSIFLDNVPDKTTGVMTLEINCYRLHPKELVHIQESDWGRFLLYSGQYTLQGLDVTSKSDIERFAVKVMCDVQLKVDALGV